jgi:hypothetical protein
MLGDNWGATAQEQAMAFPCDPLLPEAENRYHRAVTVQAPAPVVFRWLCQLRAAPYSYDWIDNFGRRSPRELTPGLEQLAVGQRVLTIFHLAGFEPDRHITIVLDRGRRLFGRIAGTYLVVGDGEQRCRLVVRLAVVHPRRPVGAVTRRLLPPGDLVMMRKQLLTLKKLAERTAPA